VLPKQEEWLTAFASAEGFLSRRLSPERLPLKRLSQADPQPKLSGRCRARRWLRGRLAGWGDYSCFSENMGFAKDSGTNDPKTQ
jgi:hypothetical protein